MAVRIRMKRLGRRNRPHWRICATDKRAARDGRVIEELGHYDPYLDNENKVAIHRDRVVHWLRQGAWPSKTVTELLGHLGLDAKGNEIPPRPWPKKKQQAPPPKAAERVAAEKAQAAAAQAESAEPAPEADAEPAPAPDAEPLAGGDADVESAPAPDDADPPGDPADAAGQDSAAA